MKVPTHFIDIDRAIELVRQVGHRGSVYDLVQKGLLERCSCRCHGGHYKVCAPDTFLSDVQGL